MGEQSFGANSVDAEVGYNAKTMRSKLGLSQGQIAEQLGLTLDEYRECESGMRRYGPERLLKLARLMDVNPSYFFETLPARRIVLSAKRDCVSPSCVEITTLRNSPRGAPRVVLKLNQRLFDAVYQ
jgi:transcriptional regulator with XRE-family HTH domain